MVRLTLTAAALAAGLASAAAASTASTYTATSYSTGSGAHSIYMNGKKFHFGAGAKFVDNGSTATLSGTALNGNGNGFDVDLHFDFIQTGPGGGIDAKGKKHGDESTWRFWDLYGDDADETDTNRMSTISGVGAIDGVWDVISKPTDKSMVFQSGLGANDKDKDFGMSGWFFLSNRDGSGKNRGCDDGSVCDFNLDLSLDVNNAEVPLPMSAVLLLGGIAGLGGLRRMGRKEEG